ncbi:MAG: hypothetical protein V8Q76_04315 [Bacteroides intestinalis]
MVRCLQKIQTKVLLLFLLLESLVVDDFGKQLQGNVVYYNRQTSIAFSSQRRSWTMSDDEKKAFAGAECNGEILNGFDGLNGSTMVANGLKITNEDNLKQQRLMVAGLFV